MAPSENDIISPVIKRGERAYKKLESAARLEAVSWTESEVQSGPPLGQNKSKLSFTHSFVLIGSMLIWWLICAIALCTAWASQDMPDLKDMWTEKRPASIVFLDRYGQSIATRGARASKPVNLAILPDYVAESLIAIEDRRYHYHPGLDPIGMVNAMRDNLQAGKVVRGGSTLSQQLAKNLFLTPERSIKRKSQELLLALWLEHKFTKTEILELYLGRVYFGAGAWGLDAAAVQYFAKPASDLDLGESAMLAGLLKAPSYYSPYSDSQPISDRTTLVLEAMERSQYISLHQRKQAYQLPIAVEPPSGQDSVDYFIDWIWPELVAFIGEPNIDVMVRTTLDGQAQAAGEMAIVKHLAPDRGADQAALLAMDGSGAVRALIGGADYSESEFNRAVQARRQPGSAFKPFVYLSAMRRGLRPWDYRDDAPIIVGDWEPTNFSNEYSGPVTLAEGFAKSLNTIAVLLSEEAGHDFIVQTAAQMGLEGLLPYRSLALGAQDVSLMQLTQSYLPFANWGEYRSAYGIDTITDWQGRQLYVREPDDVSQRRLSVRELHDMNLLMSKTISEGTGRAARIAGHDVAGKTGTTNDYRDAWFMGFAPDMVAGIWVGNDTFSPMQRVTGGSIPARIWRDFMTVALRDYPSAELPKTSMPDPVPLAQTDRHTMSNPLDL